MTETTSKRIICRTVYAESVLDEEFANRVFNYLKKNIEWEDGVRSRSGFTRKAKPLQLGQISLVDDAIQTCLLNLTQNKYHIAGIYLNYYQNGSMFTPNHSHPGTHQLVISLGATRTLNVAKKSYKMNNGDAIIFGSATHGVPKEDAAGERISIATFMYPIQQL
jgi:hypothetical protein